MAITYPALGFTISALDLCEGHVWVGPAAGPEGIDDAVSVVAPRGIGRPSTPSHGVVVADVARVRPMRSGDVVSDGFRYSRQRFPFAVLRFGLKR